MNYSLFQNTYKNRQLLSVNEILNQFPDFDTSLLVDWQKKEYIQKIINRFYLWKNIILTEGQLFFIANKIYPSSYISLKSALRYYNFIPEGVYQYFSISTRKTISFRTPIGLFHYKNLKPELFFGYRPVLQQELTLFGERPKLGAFLIAEPEKALLDTLYLTKYLKDELDIEGLRLNYDLISERCDLQKLQEYSDKFENKRVTFLTKIIIENIND